MKQGHTFIYSLLKFEKISSIHCLYIATKPETRVHMMENAIYQFNIHCLIFIHLFDQKKVFGEPRCGDGGDSCACAVEQRWRRRSGGGGDRLERHQQWRRRSAE
jgi:hypothetical protein